MNVMRPTDYVFLPAAIPALPVAGSEQKFPVRRLYCVGRNYAEHAIEMGHDPNREPPFFFQKNPDSLVLDGRFPYPPATADVHFEIELVVALGSGGSDIPVERALDCVYGYAVGLDMTRRDLQRRQTGDLSQLIWKIPETIAYLSGLFTLAAGDLIMTGTPAGVGAVQRGDVMKGGVEGVGEIEVRVV